MMRTVFFLPLLFLAAFCMLFTACSESVSDLSDDPAPDNAALPKSAGDSPMAPASASDSSGFSRQANVPPTGPRLEPTLCEIPKLEDLPKWMQYTEKEWQAIMEKHRLEQVVEIDYANAEVINCNNCAMVLFGVILKPPFYINKTKEEGFVNGYRFYPSKRIYEYRRSKEYQELKKKAHDKSYKPPRTPCSVQDSQVRSYVRELAKNNYTAEQMNEKVTSGLKAKGIIVKEFYYKDFRHFDVVFSSATCKKSSTGLYLENTAIPISPGMLKKNEDEIPTDTEIGIELLRSLAKDNRLFSFSCETACQGGWMEIEYLCLINNILNTNINPRIKLDLLMRKTHLTWGDCFGVLANK